MSSSDDLWQNVKNFLGSLPNDGKKTFQKLNIFLKSAKAWINGSDVIIIVPNMIVKQYLEHDDYLNAITKAFNECTKSQHVVSVSLNKDFSVTKTKKTVEAPINSSNVHHYDSLSNNRITDNTNVNISYNEKSKLFSDAKIVDNVLIQKNSINKYSPRDALSMGEYTNLVSEIPQELTAVDLVGQKDDTYKFENEESFAPKIENESHFRSINSSSNEDIHANIFYKINSIDKTKRFDNFVEGPTNEKLCNCGKQVSIDPGNPERNPFFVYGDPGLGKTHILYAIGNSITKTYKNLKVMYVNMNTFIRDYYSAVNAYYKKGYNDEALMQFRSMYRNLDVLLIDDMQVLQDPKKDTESVSSELTSLINDISSTKHQLIFASNMHPQSMSKVDPRLKDRFRAGVCIKVEPPDYDTRRKIICKKVEEIGLKLDQSSIDFITYKFQTNVRTLEGHIKTIGAFANKKEVITVDFVKDVLRDALAGQEKLLTVDNIKKTVAEYYKITVKEIDSTARPTSIVYPRMMAMFLARELTQNSFPMLGKEFGGKDHSTVMNAQKKMKKLIDTKQQYKDDYENIKLLLG